MYPRAIKARLLWHLSAAGKLNHIPDEEYLKMYYEAVMKRTPDFEHPRLLTEKIQWLKMYDQQPIYTKMVDKYEVKKLVAELVGEEHVIPVYGVWDRFEDIDFNSLPNQFVLKCTHDSGGLVICKDKATFDKEAAAKKLIPSLQRNYSYMCREWVYKNIKPRIMAEKYMDTLGNPDSIEYKATFFNGKFDFMTICIGVPHVEFYKRTNDHFDENFTPMPWYTFYKHSKKEVKKPEQWDELLEFNKKLATGIVADIPYLRVDTYIINGKLYFGEFTFYTWGGFLDFNPPEWDEILGSRLQLPSHKTIEK